jgi:hypothetical protein
MGGYGNTVSGYSSFVGGGSGNTASGYKSAILGGNQNIAGTSEAMIVGSNITANRTCTTFVNNLSIMNIPTAAAGLPQGSVWANGTVLEIIP